MQIEVAGADGVVVRGSVFGPPGGAMVLGVHGFTSNAERTWIDTGWVRAVTETGRQLALFDLRGHGSSDHPHEPDAYHLTHLASDAIQVLDELGVERAHWLGYSLGARLGLEVARTAPGRLASLSLGGLASTDPTPERLLALASSLGADDPALTTFAFGVSTDAPPMPDYPVGIPAVVVAGTEDDIASGAAGLAARIGADFVALPGRTHANAVTARAFKTAMLGMLDSIQENAPDVS
ncbi:MAG: alpha/beta fold hydrolase [Rhodoglobus sp.]